MWQAASLSSQELDNLDRLYREGGLRVMASPHVHYDIPNCAHAGCPQEMEWIDFKLELHGDPEGVDKPLVSAWWSGTGFAGRCPSCGGWVRFTTRAMTLLDDAQAAGLPQLPRDWSSVAQIA
jgi:hypothetical protein